MKRIISIIMLICLMISQSNMLVFAATEKEAQALSVQTTQNADTKKTYEPNTQTYTTEDGSSHTIYWAQGITPPKMTSDESKLGTQGYFEKEVIPSDKGKNIVYQYPYEAGNGYYDLNKNTYRMDKESHLCYFGSALNLIYWWFGQNSKYIDEYTNRLETTNIYAQPSGLKKILPFDNQLWTDILTEPPINYVQDVGYSQEIATSQLAQRSLSYYFTRDKGFFTDCVIDYFINGYPAANASDGQEANRLEEYTMDNTGGYFYPIFDKHMITQRYMDARASQYSFYNDNLANYFNEGKGVGIAYRIGGATLAHAITVWGAEYDENNNLVRVYVTDTDDYTYTTVKNPDKLRGMHSMDAYPSADGLMLLGNNVDNHDYGARVYYITTVDLAQDKWEYALNDTDPPKDAEIISQPQDEIYPTNAQPRPTKIVAQVSGNDPRSYLSYQWYESDKDGNNAVKLKGQTTNTLTPDISKEGVKYYYCDVISNKNGHEHPIKSRIVKITVDPSVPLSNAKEPGFSFNNSTQICDVNSNIVLNTNAYSKDGGDLSYQWYEALDSSGRGSWKLNGQTSATLRVDTSKSMKKYYYCEVTNTNNSATGIRSVTKKTSVKLIIIDASDRSAANAIVSMINAINPSDYSKESYQLLQDYYKAYKKDLDRGNTQAEVDLATSELITYYEALVPYLSLDLEYENEGTVSVQYSNKNNQSKTNKILFGDQVTLKANTNSGYQFVGWYETITKRMYSANPTYTFTMASSLNFKPIFKLSGTSTLIFTNKTGQYVESINKSNSEWATLNSISSILPEVPYSYGYKNGRWVYDENQALTALKNGEDVTITPQYDDAIVELPQLPNATVNTPSVRLHYKYDASNRVGSFILASNIPKNINVVASGVLFTLGDDKFDPSSVILNLNNKTLVSQFEGSASEPYNIVNILRLDRRHNVAAKGYVTYYDNYGSLKTVYTNQVNIVNCENISK